MCTTRFAACVYGNAPNNFLASYLKKQVSCQQSAELSEAKHGAVPLALDAAGLVPGELQAVAAEQTLVGFGSIVSSMVQRDWEGVGYGAAGTVTTLTSMAATEMGASWAKAVPVLGYGVNVLSTLHDLWGTISTGLQAYKACMSGQQ